MLVKLPVPVPVGATVAGAVTTTCVPDHQTLMSTHHSRRVAVCYSGHSSLTTSTRWLWRTFNSQYCGVPEAGITVPATPHSILMCHQHLAASFLSVFSTVWPGQGLHASWQLLMISTSTGQHCAVACHDTSVSNACSKELLRLTSCKCYMYDASWVERVWG